jgi:hypothetical protein
MYWISTNGCINNSNNNREDKPMLKNFIDILTAPAAAFARLKQDPTFWAPLLLLMVMTIATTCGYLLLNNEGFVRDQMIEQASNFREMTKEQRAQVEKSVETVSLTTQAIVSSVAIAIIVPIVLTISATYLSLVSKFGSAQLSFRHWFALACWNTVPTFFSNLAAILVLLTDANHQVPQGDLQVLGLVHLLNLNIHSQTLEQFGLMQIWGLVLGVIGYRQWTGTSWLNASLIALAPTVVIYGGVLYFTL